MNSAQQQRVNDQFSAKSSSMTEEDMNAVINKKEKVFSLFKKLGEHVEEVKLCWSLLGDYKSGAYKSVPWKLVAAIIFAFVYLLSPIDVIPDAIPFLGFTDDVSVFGLVLAGFAKELEAYKQWKQLQNTPSAENSQQIPEEK